MARLSTLYEVVLRRLVARLGQELAGESVPRMALVAASSILGAAWHPTRFLLDVATLATSRYLTQLVLQPYAPLHLWRPWIGLLELGAPVIGFTTASSFGLLDHEHDRA